MADTEVEVWHNASTDCYYIFCPVCESREIRYFRHREGAEGARTRHEASQGHKREVEKAALEDDRIRAEYEDELADGKTWAEDAYRYRESHGLIR